MKFDLTIDGKNIEVRADIGWDPATWVPYGDTSVKAYEAGPTIEDMTIKDENGLDITESEWAVEHQDAIDEAVLDACDDLRGDYDRV